MLQTQSNIVIAVSQGNFILTYLAVRAHAEVSIHLVISISCVFFLQLTFLILRTGKHIDVSIYELETLNK